MRVLWSILLLLFLTPEWMGEARLPLLGGEPRIVARWVPLDAGDPVRRRVGQLVWLGGVELTSPDAAFGGFSSLQVRGDRFTLLSDAGNIVRFAMDAHGRVRAPSFAELPAGPGAGWNKADRDSESMTVDQRSGTTWVGFENSNAIWRYDRGFTHAEAHAVPPAMADWPENLGPEAMTRLADGGFVVIAEQDPWPHGKGRAAIRFSGDPTRRPRAGFRFSYCPPRGYDPSDMTVLPDGRLLILNRTYDWRMRFSAKLTIVDPARIRPGALVAGREIATLAAPLIADNFEGVAVTREGTATIVWIVSDDNLSILQRSLLLKFRLAPDAPAPR